MHTLSLLPCTVLCMAYISSVCSMHFLLHAIHLEKHAMHSLCMLPYTAYCMAMQNKLHEGGSFYSMAGRNRLPYNKQYASQNVYGHAETAWRALILPSAQNLCHDNILYGRNNLPSAKNLCYGSLLYGTMHNISTHENAR